MITLPAAPVLLVSLIAIANPQLPDRMNIMQEIARSKRLKIDGLANYIFQTQKNPARKIAGLNQLTESGREVRHGQEIDILLISGERCEWRALEFPNNWGAFKL